MKTSKKYEIQMQKGMKVKKNLKTSELEKE